MTIQGSVHFVFLLWEKKHNFIYQRIINLLELICEFVLGVGSSLVLHRWCGLAVSSWFIIFVIDFDLAEDLHFVSRLSEFINDWNSLVIVLAILGTW